MAVLPVARHLGLSARDLLHVAQGPGLGSCLTAYPNLVTVATAVYPVLQYFTGYVVMSSVFPECTRSPRNYVTGRPHLPGIIQAWEL